MKKTLTLLLMAAVALATGTVFTSCSGGGDGEKSPDDVITLNDFRMGKKEFHINSLAQDVIVPEKNRPEAQGANQDTVYVTGYGEFAGATFDCDFVYRTDELNHEDGVPTMSWLWITFVSLEAVSSPSVLASLGMDPQGTGMVGSAVEMQFNFTSHEVQVLTSTQGTVTINYPDPMGEYITFNAWVRSVMNSNFYVTKRNADSN